MPINISDVVVNIGQKTNFVDWFDFYKTILSVLLGGLMTYLASKKMKTNDAKKESIQKFILISHITHFCFNAICTYKENVICEIKKNIAGTAIPENLTCIYIPQEEFNIDIKDYIFLGAYNLYFPDLLNQTNIIYQLFKDTIDTYNEFVKNDKSYKLMLKEQYTFDKDSCVKRVNALENITNELLLRLYYILKNCNICYDKYFNLGCFDNIKENFDNLKLEEKPILKEVLDNEKYKAVKEYQANFEKSWVGQSRFGCTICYIIRRIRHWFKWLKIFFQLPENCKFANKKNKEEKPTNES